MNERYKCRHCGKIMTGRMPIGGDGTFYFPRRHKGPDGKPCPGNFDEADPVDDPKPNFTFNVEYGEDGLAKRAIWTPTR